MSNKEPKYTDSGVRLCDQKECEYPATHTFIWAQQGWTCQCLIHTQKMLGLERMLGYNIAANSVCDMKLDKMVAQDDTPTE